MARHIATVIDRPDGDARCVSGSSICGQVDGLAVFALHPVGSSPPSDRLFARHVRLAEPTDAEGRVADRPLPM
jgi:hypothetical protein